MLELQVGWAAKFAQHLCGFGGFELLMLIMAKGISSGPSPYPPHPIIIYFPFSNPQVIFRCHLSIRIEPDRVLGAVPCSSISRFLPWDCTISPERESLPGSCLESEDQTSSTFPLLAVKGLEVAECGNQYVFDPSL